MYQGQLSFCRLDVGYKLANELKPIDFIGSIIRGAIGNALRLNNCSTGAIDCQGCRVTQHCGYHQIFEPTALVESHNGTRLQSLTPPLILQVEEMSDNQVLTESLNFKITLVCPSQKAIINVISALSSIEWLGKGRNRSGLTLQNLTVVDQYDRVLISSLAQLSKSSQQELTFYPQFEPQKKSAARVFLRTPLRTKLNGQLMRPEMVTAVVFLSLIARRVNLLNKAYAKEECSAVDYEAFTHFVSTCRIVTNKLLWRDQSRYSSRQRSTMKIGGICGEMVLQTSDSDALSQLLTLARIINLGQNCVFGLGRIDFDYGGVS